MNFEEMYRKVQEGTATDEEKAYVEEKIRGISAILDEQTAKHADITKADSATVKAARKRFNQRSTIRTVVLVVSVLAVIAIGVCGYIFGTSIPAAKAAANVSREEAVAIAKQYVIEQADLEEDTLLFVDDVDRELDAKNGLSNAIFHYEIKINVYNAEYKIDVNAKSGYATVLDIDYGD